MTAGISAPPLHGRCTNCETAGGLPIRSSPERRYGMPGHFTLVRCARCGLVRTEPAPADPAAYYPAGEYYAYRPPAAPSARKRRRYERAYGVRTGAHPANGRTSRWPAPGLRSAAARATARWLEPGMPPGPVGRLLDVGCGSGQFLKHVEAAGWTAFGIDPSEEAVNAARQAGLERVWCGVLPAPQLEDAGLDAVRFWHVLEHIGDPRTALVEARRLLRPGGSLTVGVPNHRSLLARIAKDDWFYLDVPRHLWHFDKRTLRELVESCGFEVEKLRTSTTTTPLLGTLDYRRGTGERLVQSRRAFYAGLPVAIGLDALGIGCGLELVARRPS